MVFNPYTAAAARLADHQISQGYLGSETNPNPTPAVIQDFFDAMCINHAGNRARVCTAIAWRMSRDEVAETIRRIDADRQATANKLEGLDAPEVIVNNERIKDQWAVNLLGRILVKMGG